MKLHHKHLNYLALAVFCFPSWAMATPERDAAWNELIAEAIRRGGAETISGKTASYVFGGPDGLSVTFTRTLDNRVRAVCAGYMSANINVCVNWDSQKIIYSRRENENAPWVNSFAPPEVPASKTPVWISLLSTFLDTDLSESTLLDWRRGHVPKNPTNAFSHAFASGFHRGRAR